MQHCVVSYEARPATARKFPDRILPKVHRVLGHPFLPVTSAREERGSGALPGQDNVQRVPFHLYHSSTSSDVEDEVRAITPGCLFNVAHTAILTEPSKLNAIGRAMVTPHTAAATVWTSFSNIK